MTMGMTHCLTSPFSKFLGTPLHVYRDILLMQWINCRVLVSTCLAWVYVCLHGPWRCLHFI